MRGQPDRCEWFAFSSEVLARAVGRFDPAAAKRPDEPFDSPHGPSDAVSYARQRRVVESLHGARRPEALFVEEELVGVLARVLAAKYGRRGALAGRSPAAARRDRDLAEDARALLAASYRRAHSLTDLASTLGVSVFRLCRVFRRQTGTTLHALRNRLRLAASLELLPRSSSGLTGLALELGYCSHSHFTAAFRREFGVPPSAYRSALPASVISSSPGAERPAS